MAWLATWAIAVNESHDTTNLSPVGPLYLRYGPVNQQETPSETIGAHGIDQDCSV
jgi:hypothetical protein